MAGLKAEFSPVSGIPALTRGGPSGGPPPDQNGVADRNRRKAKARGSSPIGNMRVTQQTKNVSAAAGK